MKKLMCATVAAALLALSLYAQNTSQGSSGQTGAESSASSTKTPSPPLRTIAGTISDDGKTFTADKDKKQWTLKNPEDVKGHEGHHVKLQAHVYADTNELHVMKVTMMGAKRKEKSAETSGASNR
jgi:hypothetical protein